MAFVLWGWWGHRWGTLEVGGTYAIGHKLPGQTILIHLPVALVLGVASPAWSLGHFIGWGGSCGSVQRWHMFNLNRYGIEILIYGFISGILRMVQYQVRAQREAMKSLELQRQPNMQLRLQMQLEPHFQHAECHYDLGRT